jgi:hypothetical protein
MIGNTRLYSAVHALATMSASAKERMEVALKNLSVISEYEHDINPELWTRIQTLTQTAQASNNEENFRKNAEEVISIWLETNRK